VPSFTEISISRDNSRVNQGCAGQLGASSVITELSNCTFLSTVLNSTGGGKA